MSLDSVKNVKKFLSQLTDCACKLALIVIAMTAIWTTILHFEAQQLGLTISETESIVDYPNLLPMTQAKILVRTMPQASLHLFQHLVQKKPKCAQKCWYIRPFVT